VLNNEPSFQRLVSFLIDSAARYRWFGRRFVVMPDHIHLIASMGQDAVTLGQWVKALKAVVGGLEERSMPSPGESTGMPVKTPHPFTRMKRSWHWQPGFHDHKFRSAESEHRKWEYICLNPIRARLVVRPEQWPYAGEILHNEPSPRVVRGTPPLFETGLFLEGRASA
jgi:REP element-mobilizing transposase RayT